MNPETPITNALWERLSQHGWGREHLPCSTIMGSHEKLERELAAAKHREKQATEQRDAAKKTRTELLRHLDAARENERKAQVQLVLAQQMHEAERALADRLAGELQWWGDYCGDSAPASIDLALDAWKEARSA